MGTCGIGNGAKEVYESLQKAIKAKRAKIELTPVGCFGFCAEETLVNCYVPGQPLDYPAQSDSERCRKYC